MASMCVRRREMAVEIKGGLGFDLSPLFIVEGMIWALTVHNASPENLKL
jgi:hypothetical protein